MGKKWRYKNRQKSAKKGNFLQNWLKIEFTGDNFELDCNNMNTISEFE
jgi:hypothetical protein